MMNLRGLTAERCCLSSPILGWAQRLGIRNLHNEAKP